ncbi:protein AHNAK2 [Eschrichtius robustus]|uniref:protein AHNAK2 n=1 Tax=Eschrichtius robustus TaxID=9764 RepID=UPI0035C00C31
MEPGLPSEGAPGEGAGPAPRQSGEGAREGTQALEIGIARLSLQDSAGPGSHQNHQPEFHVRIPILKPPKFGLYKEEVLEKEGATTALQGGPWQRRVSGEDAEAKGEDAGEAEAHRPRQPPVHQDALPAQAGGDTEDDAARKGEEDSEGGDPHTEEKEGKTKMLKLKLPSFGWSPAKEAKGDKVTQLQEMEKEKESSTTVVTSETDIKGKYGLETDSKFKMPKFRMPSFGVSAPRKSVEAAVEVSVPKAQAEVTLPSVQANVKTSDLSIKLPSAELEVKAAEVGVKLPEGHIPKAEPKEAAAGIGLKGHLPKMQVPSIKVPKGDIKAPQVDIKGPKVDLKDAKGEVMAPEVKVSLPSVKVDTQAASTKLESDMSLGEKEVAARDSKFKMPKFKMLSFGVSAPSKFDEAAMEVSVPKAQAEVTLPSVQANVKTSDFSIELPSAELEVKAAEEGVKLPEGHIAEAESKEVAAGIGLKGHQPRVQMPSIKAPQVDIKGPKLDLKDTKGEVTAPDMGLSLPSVEVGTQSTGTKLAGDVSLGDKEVAARDSKFKMPKFKMPSFGESAPSKSVKAAVDVSVPKAQAEVTLPLVQAEVTLPSVHADVKTSDLSIELPSAELEVKAAEVGVKLPEGHHPEAEPKEAAAGIGLKSHLPKVQIPSIKVPKVDIKGPKLDLKDDKGEVTALDVEVSLPNVEVDTQAAGTKLADDVSMGDKEVAARDSKFKMPKFKVPSFGVSAPSKSLKASVEVSVPKAQAEVTLPSVQADVKTSDLNIELPSAELEVKAAEVGMKLPEGHLPEAEPKEAAAGIGLKGHLPKVQMPSIKVPKVDIKGPKLDLKDDKGEVTAPDMEMSLPSMKLDTQAAGSKLEGDVFLGDKEVAIRDSKFKMPKFKMPSFGVSVPSKSVEATLEVSVPKAQAEVTLPSVQADVKTSDLSIKLPSAELEVKAAEVGVKLPEGHLPEVEPKEAAAGIGLKGHLPKVQMPSIKVPKVDIKGPKLDLKDAKGEVTAPDVEMSLPSVEVDTQVAGSKLVCDVSLRGKEVAARDSKFKMPKFKMPSFGVSAPRKPVKAPVEVSVPKAQAEVTLPSVQADGKTSDLSIELPSAELEVKAAEVGVKLPEGHIAEAEPKEAAAGIGLKGHLPKVQMPSMKVPKVDIKGPKLDLKEAKGEVTAPDVEMLLPSVEVDTQAMGSKLEGDVSMGDKEVAARDSQFKMPKFKMPSFGVSAPSKFVEAAVEVSVPKAQAEVPKAQAEVTRPSLQADVKTSDLSIEQPSAELDVKAAEVGVKLPEGHLPEAEPKEAATGIGLKGHLPRVQMPSIKVPKVDIKAPQVDIKGPKVHLKDDKGEVTAPDMEVSLPSMEVDTQAAGTKLEGDVSLGDKEVAARDSKFKMPKFKVPSFGVSAPRKSVEAAVEVSVPKAQAEVTLPSVQADVKTSDFSIELPSAELEVKVAEVGVKLPEGHHPEAEPKEAAAGIGLKGHLPKVQMPSIKVPKVDIKGPKLDLKDTKGEVTAPDVEMSLHSVAVDTQAAGSKLEGDVSMRDKQVAARDSQFKMPKFKMPSFGVSAPSKSVEAAVEVSVPKAQAEVTRPSVQADVKTSDLSIEQPSAELDVKAAKVGVKLPEGHLPETEPKEAATGIGLKGHLPRVQMPSIKVPRVDIKAPKVDIKGPKLDLKDTKGEVTAPDVVVSLPSVEVDTQTTGTKLAGDMSLGDKEVAARDSKFKRPKFKMPSFGVSAPSKSVKATVEVSVPKAQAEVTLPSVQADSKTSDLNIELPSAELEVKAAEEGVKLPEGHIAEAEPKEVAAGIGLKGHMPKVQKPGIKVPKVDIKGPKLDLKEAKGEVTAPDMEVSLPSVEVDTQAAGTKLEGDVSLGDKEVAARDSKFKMPKFKVPSFGVSAPRKSVEASVEVSVPKAQAEVTLPSVQADVKTSDFSIELPSAELEVKVAEVGVKLPKGHHPEAEPKVAAAGIGLKGHLPKVQMPSITVPKVDIKEPKLDLKDTKGEVTAPDVEMSLPSVEVDTQATGSKLEGDVFLGDKEVAARDSQFKMPKFKMPSFGVSAPSKFVEAAVEVSVPKAQAEVPKAQAEVTRPSLQADVKTSDLSIEQPSAELDVKAAEVGVKLPEGHLPEAEPKEAATGIGLKGHLPRVQMPSIKVPKVDIKAPQVDIKGPKVHLKDDKGEVTAPDMEVSLPSMEVDTQAAGTKLEGDVSLGDKEVAARDSKFKMPKFKVPSFGVSAPRKSVEAAVEVSVPKAQAEVTLPSVQADVKTSDFSIELPSAELEVKVAEVGVKLPEGHHPEAEPKEAAAGIGLKGHLPKVQMPSIKVPKVDIKGPKLDLKDTKGEVTAPDVEMSLHSVAVDTQAAGSKLEGDVSMRDKQVAARDSQFKMPKFKMPSFGVSAPSKSVEAAVEVSVPKAQAEVTRPSVQADVKTSDLSIEQPSAELDVKAAKVGVKLPEGHLPETEPKEAATGIGLKGHLPRVQMPSIKVPKVDIKAPQVDIKGPKVDLKDDRGEVTAPGVEVSLPSVEVDTQAAGTKLEGDVSLGDKEVAARDSKFKMPKFKVPSFGVSAPRKSVEAAVEVSVPKAQAEVTLPSVQADVKTSDFSIELPSAELEVKVAEVGVKLPEGHHPEAEPKEAAAGIGLKGHLPKVQMPSIKVPKVDIKGPKLDLRDAKGEVTAPDVEMSLPSVEVDTQAAGSKLEGDVSLGDKEVAARDSQFKMPKFKMPSFGVSAPSKSVEAAVEVSVPKAQAEVTQPSLQADVKTSDLSIEQPSAELDVKAAEVGVKLPEGHLPEAEPMEAAARIGLKGDVPKVQMPSIKVPKVDIKAPQVDIKGPKVDLKDDKGEVTAPGVEVSLPSVEVDTQAAGTKLEGDVSLGDKEVAARDSKFKMPKFKVPSFGVSAPRKSVEAAVEVSVPKAQAEVTLPSVQADVKTSDFSIELPSAELEVKVAEVGVKLPEGHHPEAEPKEAAAGIGLKGHLPKVQMPSIKVPKVDIKEPKLDLKDTKGEVTAPDVEMSLPSVEVDTQAVGSKLEGDVSLGDKDLAARVRNIKMEGGGNIQIKKSHFKIPKFFSSSGKSFKSSAPVDVNFGVSLPPSTSVTFSEFSGGGSLTQDSATREPSVPLPWLGWPGFSGSLDLGGTHAEPASLSPAEGIILTKYQVTLPGAAVPPELPLEAAPCSQNDAHLPSTESSARLPTQERVAVSQTDRPAGPVDPMFLASYGRVSFPKFHPPKFGFSVPEAADAEVEAGAGDCAPSLSTTGPARGLDSTAVPRSAGPSAVAAGETPAKDTERGGKDSPLKMPWIKLPSFMWSPKKGTVPPGDPERSLDSAELGVAVDTGPKGMPPGCPVSAAEVAVDALPDKDGEGRGMKSPGCAVLEHAPPTAPAPEGGPGLPRGDPAAPRSRPPAGGGARATERAGGAAGAGGTGTVVGPPEGAGADLRLPQAPAPLLDFARPDLRPSKAKVGVSSSAGGPPSLGHSSQGHGLRDGSASQPLGEATAPSVGDPQQPSCSPANVDVPAMETAASPGGWFRMPALRLPSIRRPAKERGVAGARGAPVPAPAASALREGERPAPVKGQGVPGSEVEEAMSLQPPEAGADEAAAELASYADAHILKRNLEEKGSEPHLSAAGVPAADLSPSEVRVRPGEGSLPLQMPSGRLSGTQAPLGEMGTAPAAGPAGLDLAAGEGRAEERSSQPEGPIKLKASRTDGPSQVSVVNMGQPWEGSVVTVKLPRISVPRFAFPDPSSEADIFIPAVTEVRCPGSSLAHALHEESPGVWGASILKAGAGTPGEQPMTLDFSPEASPISKVRMRTQHAQGESPEVAVHSRVTAELADLSGPEAISTQVVRQLEIPASEIQTASYGFSLLKVKMPEPRTQVSVRDSRLREGLQEASKQATPGADPASGDLQPDTGGPFEVISSSVNVPGPPTFTPKVHSGYQGADSCSDDEEAAEILESPPEDESREAAASLAEEGRAPEEKPEGKRSSGLFRFWLPSTGLSSSAEETRAHSKDEARSSAPVQTQAGARPEAEPPKKPEKAGWFRFPKLGFSSSHTEKTKSSEDEAALAEQKLQEQAVTFFDAPESFSPEDKGAGEPVETAGARPGARAVTTSTARTELGLREQDPEGGMNLHPGPPPSEDRRTDERRPCEAATVRARVSTLIHSTESGAEVPECGGAPPSHSPPRAGPQKCRRPRTSAAEAASGLPTRPCAPEGPH